MSLNQQTQEVGAVFQQWANAPRVLFIEEINDKLQIY